MIRILKIHGLIFKVSYDSKFFEKAFRDLESCQARGASGAVLEIKKSRKAFPIPDKALRVHYNSKRQTAEYVSGPVRYYLSPELTAAVNPEEIRFTIHYKKISADTIWHFEQALGWMIKTLGARKNKIYLPGQLLRRGKRLILITGHPECGKTECLKALKKQKLVPALSSILLASGRLFLFDAGLAAKRVEAEKIRKILKTFPVESEPSRLDRIIFVNAWNERLSALQRLKPEEAASELFNLSRRAYEYFLPQQSAAFRKDYRGILKRIPCYRFLMGKDRRAASKSMLSF